ncbi:hypothetical protein CCY99_07850 [Helicobacter sp. 16-1353]|uniref:tetratricopeptide repeat protein n=1 Tax=Helicobacter sp. 16-1353 TaxID=2004996 RepID=UPI000DCD70BD|nr:hypothetical protein [Helicobacter sp. 16-1353]RAX52055.1 hypothetical protein CCY99_07850 [Helicobacter sp. 16-1353]
MKKIIELEDRWKAYRYKKIIFYIFIVVFITFIIFVGVFIKFQYDRYTAKSNAVKYAKQIAKAKESTNNTPIVVDSNTTQNHSSSANAVSQTEQIPAIDFVCRKVIVDKLTVRKEASFKSKPVGYYSNNAIFCAENINTNGLLKTNNGWVSANDSFSQIVEVNMFVDSGFHKSPSRNQQVIAKAPVEEVKVFENTPTRYANASSGNTQNTTQTINSAPIEKARKPIINISSEKITKEKEIELKQADFKRSNNYDIAIDIAEYYYENKDYKNSIKWALNASSADSGTKLKTQSWIIYAKSLYATGKKEQAIEVLNRYIANTNSRDAIDALNNIKQGII